MKKIVRSAQFKKDFKRVSKRGCPLQKLTLIISLLAEDQALPERCKPHRLSGNYQNFWECHIEPDWLLIYAQTNDELQLRRTGTHSDLFG